MSLAEDVLELARWAPSGDNSQPWRFKVVSERDFDVYGYDTRTHCVYDLDGWSSQLAHGML
ncbi:MAG: nitroreductase family protein, partial [Casimicrobiaceae bacterium]